MNKFLNDTAEEPKKMADKPREMADKPRETTDKLREMAWKLMEMAWEPRETAEELRETAYNQKKILQMGKNKSFSLNTKYYFTLFVYLFQFILLYLN